MIQEIIACDELSCDEAQLMPGSTVPDRWVVYDGKHFCTPICLSVYVQGSGGAAA